MPAHQKFKADYSKIESLFAQIGKIITSSVETKSIIHSTMQLVEAYFQPANWSIFEYHPETQDLTFAFAKGLNEIETKGIRLKLGEGIVGHVAKTKQSLLENEVDKNPLFSRKVDESLGFKTNSIIAVPIVFQDQILGVIELINTLDNHQFSTHNLVILETIADFAAIALTNAKAYEKATFLAFHDPLTKLYNRAYLNKLYGLNSGENGNTPENGYLLVVWIDLDGFKEVNDNQGHNAGDEVLCRMADLLQAINAGNDYLFRVGGDEFLLLRMNLSKAELPRERETMHKLLEDKQSAVAPATGFSFGISTGFQHQLDKVIAKADELMYETKREHHQAKDLSSQE